MSNPIKDKAAIVGTAQTEFAKGIERSEPVLALEVVKGCLEDAGLSGKDVDGIFIYDIESEDESWLAQNLGCRELKFWGKVP